MRARRLAARWVIPVEGPPIERGAVLIGLDGRVREVGPDAAVSRPADIPAEDFDDAVILPGLINTHTHLELTGFEGRISEPEFPAWIRRLRELKTTRSPGEYVEAARRGLRDCYAAGVTTIADTGDTGAAIQALGEADGSGSPTRKSLALTRSRLRKASRDCEPELRSSAVGRRAGYASGSLPMLPTP